MPTPTLLDLARATLDAFTDKLDKTGDGSKLTGVAKPADFVGYLPVNGDGSKLTGVAKPADFVGYLPVNGDGSQLTGVLHQADLLAALTAVIAALPTTLPSQPGKLWNNGGVIQIS